MAKNISLTLTPTQSKLGQIKIAPRVLKIIASIAANQIKGVNRMQSSLTTHLFGHRYSGNGIKISFNRRHQLVLDIYVYLNYHVSVPVVAAKIQDKVKQQLLFMTDLKVDCVNVHINGIVPTKFRSQVNPDHLFSNKDDQK